MAIRYHGLDKAVIIFDLEGEAYQREKSIYNEGWTRGNLCFIGCLGHGMGHIRRQGLPILGASLPHVDRKLRLGDGYLIAGYRA